MVAVCPEAFRLVVEVGGAGEGIVELGVSRIVVNSATKEVEVEM
jgi:hypothetical protein